jgi:hypothetical protein
MSGIARSAAGLGWLAVAVLAAAGMPRGLSKSHASGLITLHDILLIDGAQK